MRLLVRRNLNKYLRDEKMTYMEPMIEIIDYIRRHHNGCVIIHPMQFGAQTRELLERLARLGLVERFGSHYRVCPDSPLYHYAMHDPKRILFLASF